MRFEYRERRVEAILRRCPALFFGVVMCSQAVGAPGDAFTPEASVTYFHDDNFLRIADGQGKEGIAQGDNTVQSTAGISVNANAGMQVFSAKARIAKFSFDRLTQLDYIGEDYSALWNWHVKTHLSGNLGDSYLKVLAPYGDIQSTERNLRMQRRRYADIAWSFHPSWRVRGSMTRDSYAYELVSLRASEHTDVAQEAGLDYLASNGSTVGIQLRRVKGSYAFPQFVNGQAFDNGNIQDEAKLKIDWRAGGITGVQFLGGWVNKTHRVLVERDARGTNGRINADWAPLGKIRFSASVWDEFGTVDSSYFTSSINRGISAASVWQPDIHFQVKLGWRRENRNFRGELISLSDAELRDVTRGTTLYLSYAPVAKILVSLTAARDTRTVQALQDTYGLKNYRSRSAGLTASIQF
jgi:exopolysaccharide biosynthesis operon protein EpsL